MTIKDQKIAETMDHALLAVEDTRVHVDLNLLDQLMNLTGELVLARNRVTQLAGAEAFDLQTFRMVAQRLNTVAIQDGILIPEQADEMSERDLLHLIFRPGFSTSTTVTNLSGRGVGMDVVKKHLDRIGGTIEIHTERHQGTTVTLRIPITLAIIPVLIVKVANQRFAVPQVHLEELIMPQGDNGRGIGIETVSDTEVYRLRGELLPLLRLSQVLQLTTSPSPNPSHLGRGTTSLTTSPSPNPSHQGRGAIPPSPLKGRTLPSPGGRGRGRGDRSYQLLPTSYGQTPVSSRFLPARPDSGLLSMMWEIRRKLW